MQNKAQLLFSEDFCKFVGKRPMGIVEKQAIWKLPGCDSQLCCSVNHPTKPMRSSYHVQSILNSTVQAGVQRHLKQVAVGARYLPCFFKSYPNKHEIVIIAKHPQIIRLRRYMGEISTVSTFFRAAVSTTSDMAGKRDRCWKVLEEQWDFSSSEVDLCMNDRLSPESLNT